ncbi:MAG TPA: pitrilysin family protein [Verrucomicrobiae bacterium]|jgi:zinc protease
MEIKDSWKWLAPMACIAFFGCGTKEPQTASVPPAGSSAQSVWRDELPNGMRVVIVRNPLAPVVTTMINYQVGSDEAPPGFPGMAHATEHMMFRGSPGLSAEQLANISAGMGGDNNADTQQMATQYFFTAPVEDLDLALHVESIRLRGIDDTEPSWDQERGAIEQEVASDLSNPDYVFYTNLLAQFFQGTPYAWDALGSRPSFDKTTGAMLKQFHDTWYVPNNAVLVICGDVQPARTLAEVRKLFAGIPRGQLPERPSFTFQPVTPKTIRLDTDQPSGMAVIAFRVPGSDSPDFGAMQVLSDALSSQRGRLYSLVPEGKALSASFSYDSLTRAGLGYAAAQFPAGADADNLVSQMSAILGDALKNGLPPDLVEAAKRREVASLEFQKNSVAGLAMAWSQAVAIEGRQSPEDDVEAIRKVTVNDVNRVAREYLDNDHAITSILSPRPSDKPVSEKGFGGKESFAPATTKPVPLPEWAAKAIKRLDLPRSTLHPVVNILPNGLKLIVQPESVSDSVSVYGRIKNIADVETDKGKEGVDMMLGQLFSFGTKTLGRVAFQEALDNIAADESAGTDFSLQVLSENFERGVELLAGNELSPALPEKAFSILQPTLAAEISGQLESPSYLQERAVAKGLFPAADPAQRQATPESIKSLTIADVTHYYDTVFRPDLATIVVTGNVTPARARQVIEKYFGGWRATGSQPPTLWPAVPPNDAWTTTVPDSSRVQDDIDLNETVGLTLSNPDRYALELGNHVLGGGLDSSRLYRDLRTESGLVYFVDSSFQFGQTRSIYKVSYGCDPPKAGKARAIIASNLKAMQEHDVTPEELRQAKGLLLRNMTLAEASVERIAQEWLYLCTHGEPLDEQMRAARRYMELTAPEVRAAFAKWIRIDGLGQVALGPAPQ